MKTKTRRDFLRTVGVGAAGVAIVGIGSSFGCSPGGETAQGTSKISDTFDYEGDVIVVGAGPAGVAAAVEAISNGCERVILLETLSTIGGSAIYSEGIMAGVDTKIAKRNNVTASLDDCFNQVMEWSNYQLDGDLVRITTEHCGETIDWLVDELEVPFVDHAIAASNYGPLPIVHNIVDQGSGFAAPYEKAITSREAITLLLNTRATHVLTNEDGTICGIEATEGNKNIRISARAVILAAGGAGGNPELLGRLVPLYKSVCPAGGPGASGDATVLAGDLGAAMANSNLFRPMVHDYEAAWAGAKAYGARLDTVFTVDGSILINVKGERFANDRPVMRMGGAGATFCADMNKHNVDYFWALNDQAGLDATQFVRWDNAKTIQADTLEDLAKIIEVEPSALIATIERWNTMVENGKDEDFGRTNDLTKLGQPPYYAVKASVGAFIWFGGVLNNAKAEALDTHGNSIPGLYAAGECSCNASWAGWAISHATTWGRIAAQNATAYVTQK